LPFSPFFGAARGVGYSTLFNISCPSPSQAPAIFFSLPLFPPFYKRLTLSTLPGVASFLLLYFWVYIHSYSMAASALLKSRVRRPSYLNKLAKAEDLIDLFPHGSYIGWSGFTGVGYPKYVSCCAIGLYIPRVAIPSR
jgi:hypothetical protein